MSSRADHSSSTGSFTAGVYDGTDASVTVISGTASVAAAAVDHPWIRQAQTERCSISCMRRPDPSGRGGGQWCRRSISCQL